MELSAVGLGRRVGGTWIWRGLDLRVAPGERLGLAGPSGSGKTLLLRALAALDPLDEGRVRLEGRPLGEWEAPRYRSRVSYLPQRPALGEGAVEASLRLPFSFAVHAERPFDRDEALRLLGELGRDESFLSKRLEELSGGEAQVAALVRTLLLAPAVLLLDEPTASMDEPLARRCESLIGEWLRADRSRAVVWTSHRADRLARVTDREVEL